MAVVESLSFSDIAEECVEDPFGGERCSHRQVTAGEPLGETEKVGCDALDVLQAIVCLTVALNSLHKLSVAPSAKRGEVL